MSGTSGEFNFLFAWLLHPGYPSLRTQQSTCLLDFVFFGLPINQPLPCFGFGTSQVSACLFDLKLGRFRPGLVLDFGLGGLQPAFQTWDLVVAACLLELGLCRFQPALFFGTWDLLVAACLSDLVPFWALNMEVCSLPFGPGTS